MTAEGQKLLGLIEIQNEQLKTLKEMIELQNDRINLHKDAIESLSKIVLGKLEKEAKGC